MVEEPDELAARYVEAGCELLIVHAEACRHLHRTLGHIRELGARPAVALNPATPGERRRARARPRRPGAGDDREPGLRRPGLHRHDGAEGRRGAAPRARRRPRRRHRGRRRHRPRRRSRARRRPAPTCWWPARRCTATPRAWPTPSPSCASWPRPPAVDDRGTAARAPRDGGARRRSALGARAPRTRAAPRSSATPSAERRRHHDVPGLRPDRPGGGARPAARPRGSTLGDLLDAAPDEVRDDLQVEIDYVQALIDALEERASPATPPSRRCRSRRSPTPTPASTRRPPTSPPSPRRSADRARGSRRASPTRGR